MCIKKYYIVSLIKQLTGISKVVGLLYRKDDLKMKDEDGFRSRGYIYLFVCFMCIIRS